MRQGFWCALVSAALLFPGCSNGPPTGTVTGEVTFEGKPIEDGGIRFEPLDGQGQTAGAPIKDGKFEATGVPATKMKVIITGNRKTGKKIKAYDTPESPVSDEIVELLPPRYNFSSEITLEVKRGSQSVKYDLKK
jgi:hypothetical protein